MEDLGRAHRSRHSFASVCRLVLLSGAAHPQDESRGAIKNVSAVSGLKLHPTPRAHVFTSPSPASHTDVSLTAPSFLCMSPQKPAQPSPPPVSDWVTHSRHPQARLGNLFQATTVRDGAIATLPCCRTHTHTQEHVAGFEAYFSRREVDESQQLLLIL